jgi:hypothetical protein
VTLNQTALPPDVVKANALFAAALTVGDMRDMTPDDLDHAIIMTIRAFGSQGCSGRVAQEFGDHPETATSRMRACRGQAARTGL